jgi:release factor glutamine methyltransferase
MSVNIQTIGDIGKFLSEELSSLYPANEISALSSIIIKTLFNIDKLHRYTEPKLPVSLKDAGRIRQICDELKTGKPIQYIFGETIFYGCRIKVNQSTLIPRQETEELADLIIKENRGLNGHIIDFGTGSGCIAIALAKNLPLSSVTAIDISAGALAIAEENAEINQVKIAFLREDILTLNLQSLAKASLIVSNPPYILESEKVNMNRNVLGFEPANALFVPDNDPLIYYRIILNHGKSLLTSGGQAYFEINEALGAETEQVMNQYGYSDIQIIKDLNGKNRFIKGKFNE